MIYWHKKIFLGIILKIEIVLHQNPYRVWEYYNPKCSLAQAFDIAINNEGLRDIGDPKDLYEQA